MSTDFWTSSSQYGLVHRAADPPANPEALVVFVHGLFGNCRRTWGRMPQWVLEAAGLDIDVVSFSYPSRPWERDLAFYPLMAPILSSVRFVTQGRRDWGRNEIIPALRWQNPWLLRLEREFLEAIEGARARDLPTPVVHDIFAKSDLSVPVQVLDQHRDIYFRGTHGSVKVPRRPSTPIVSIVAGFVRRYGSDSALPVVERVLGRVAEVNRVAGTSTLIRRVAGEAGARDRPVSTANAASLGTQEDICALVFTRLIEGSERPRQIVITGVAGVYPTSRTYDVGWLEGVFRTRAVTVILDGVDDFLVNHPTIGLSYVVDTLRGAVGRYRDNPGFAVVASVRSGLHGLERLASNPPDVVEVLRLSVAQAERTFPTCRRWLAQVSDLRVLDLVLTPLILSSFEPECDSELDRRSFTAGSIMDHDSADPAAQPPRGTTVGGREGRRVVYARA